MKALPDCHFEQGCRHCSRVLSHVSLNEKKIKTKQNKQKKKKKKNNKKKKKKKTKTKRQDVF